MTVLTIFNHGTGFGREKGINANELVAWLHENAQGNEVTVVDGAVVPGEFIINDGPGSGANNPNLPGMNNPYTGERKNHESFKYGKDVDGGERSDFARSFAGETGKSGKKFQNLMGNIGGAGWTDNVARTVFLLQSLIFDQGLPIDTVNMCGWSRGGVTCIRIANKMYEVFGEDVRVNIFALDPVAGRQAGNEMRDTRVIPANVDHFFAVLAMHEMRKTFKPQDLSRIEVQDPGRTRVLYLPMPGVHNEQVIASTRRESAEVSRSLAYGFLRSFGSRFSGAPSPFLCSVENMALHYAKMVIDLDAYKANQTSGLKNRVIGGGLRRRAFYREDHAKHYVTGGKDSYWINEHHRTCFKRAFPNFYNDVFHSNLPTMRSLGNYVERVYCAQGSHLADSLTKHGILRWTGDGPYDAQVVGGSGFYVDTRNTQLMRLSWPAHIPLHG